MTAPSVAAPLVDMDQLVRTTMARPPERPGVPRGGMSTKTLEVLSALPPADDAEAEVKPANLGLAQADLVAIAQVARAWREALAKATEAEQTYTSASRLADRLPDLQRSAGEAALRSAALNGHGRALATAGVEQIDAAKLAQQHLPVLQRERDIAADRAAQARGALCGTTTSALKGALRRAVEHFNAAALEQTRALAALESCVNALPTTTAAPMQSALNLLRLHLVVPALGSEFGPVDRASAPDRFVPTLLSASHDRFSKHVKAATGHLDLALREALGMDPRRLLG